jgi:hypothetical protein
MADGISIQLLDVSKAGLIDLEFGPSNMDQIESFSEGYEWKAALK